MVNQKVIEEIMGKMNLLNSLGGVINARDVFGLIDEQSSIAGKYVGNILAIKNSLAKLYSKGEILLKTSVEQTVLNILVADYLTELVVNVNCSGDMLKLMEKTQKLRTSLEGLFKYYSEVEEYFAEVDAEISKMLMAAFPSINDEHCFTSSYNPAGTDAYYYLLVNNGASI